MVVANRLKLLDVKQDSIKVTLRGNVSLPAKLSSKVFSSLLDTLVDFREELGNRFLFGWWHLIIWQLLEVLLSNSEQRLFRPAEEPVERTAVDKRGEPT